MPQMMPIAWAPVYLVVSLLFVLVTVLISREGGDLLACSVISESRGSSWGCAW